MKIDWSKIHCRVTELQGKNKSLALDQVREVCECFMAVAWEALMVSDSPDKNDALFEAFDDESRRQYRARIEHRKGNNHVL